MIHINQKMVELGFHDDPERLVCVPAEALPRTKNFLFLALYRETTPSEAQDKHFFATP